MNYMVEIVKLLDEYKGNHSTQHIKLESGGTMLMSASGDVPWLRIMQPGGELGICVDFMSSRMTKLHPISRDIQNSFGYYCLNLTFPNIGTEIIYDMEMDTELDFSTEESTFQISLISDIDIDKMGKIIDTYNDACRSIKNNMYFRIFEDYNNIDMWDVVDKLRIGIIPKEEE